MRKQKGNCPSAYFSLSISQKGLTIFSHYIHLWWIKFVMNMAAIFTMVNLILFLDDMGLSKSYLMAFLSEKSVVILWVHYYPSTYLH